MKRTAAIALFIATGLLPAAQAYAADSGGGLPQLDASTYPSQIFWLVVSFIIIYVAMAKISLPLVQDTLDRRRARKDSHLSQAGEINEEAEKIKKAYEKSLAEAQKKAAGTMAAAARDASAKIAQEQSVFAEKARQRLADTESNIARAKTEAFGSITEIATDIAADIAQKIAHMNVDEADAKRAVETTLKEHTA